MDTIQFAGETHVINRCGNCGVWHTVPLIVYETHQREGGYFSCPNGHARGWDKSSSGNEAIRRERDRLKQNEARLIEEAREVEVARLKAVASKVRLQKRIHNGVCPCCSRSFANLRKHMATKHPNVTPIKAAP
jgi:RNase P subunit RPR2